MQLTEFERLSLINQYQMLDLLSDDEYEKENYQKNINILSNGYEMHYGDLMYLAEDDAIMTERESSDVLEILQMFDAIDWAIHNGVDTSGIEDFRLKFAGFDGNHEQKQLGYLQFYCRKGSGNYERIVEDIRAEHFNSHAPLLGTYRSMVEEWKNSADRHHLTREDLQRITSV
jgi:uncharacterized protein YfbU (UPF0304 family)